MEMPKIDKEFLIKHRFWITSGAVVPLALMALGCLFWGVSDDIAVKAKEVEDQKKSLAKAQKEVKTNKELEILGRLDDNLSDQKEVVWKDASKLQGGLFSWPEGFPEAAQEFQPNFSELAFGDNIEKEVCAKYPDLYAAQLKKEFPQLLGPVQLGATAMRTVKDFPITRPRADDIWLAQEDFCVNREILRTIQEANSYTAHFSDRVKLEKDAVAPADKDKGERARQKYRNASREPNYELELVLVEKGKKNFAIRGKVKSTDERPIQPERLYVTVLDPRKQRREPVTPVQSNWTGPPPNKTGEEQNLPETTIDARIAPEGLFDVEQQLASKPPEQKNEVRKRFINPYWEFDLTLARGAQGQIIRGTIKNISRRRQSMDRIVFRLQLRPEKDALKVPLTVEGEPLAVGQSMALGREGPSKTKEVRIDSAGANGIYGI